MSLGSGITQLVDNGREEGTKRVYWHAYSVEAKTIEPDLRVFEGLYDSVPSKLFVLSGIVFLESSDNVFPLA